MNLFKSHRCYALTVDFGIFDRRWPVRAPAPPPHLPARQPPLPLQHLGELSNIIKLWETVGKARKVEWSWVIFHRPIDRFIEFNRPIIKILGRLIQSTWQFSLIGSAKTPFRQWVFLSSSRPFQGKLLTIRGIHVETSHGLDKRNTMVNWQIKMVTIPLKLPWLPPDLVGKSPCLSIFVDAQSTTTTSTTTSTTTITTTTAAGLMG